MKKIIYILSKILKKSKISSIKNSEIHKKGIVGFTEESDRYKINELVEKPKLAEAPSKTGILGRYIFESSIFDEIMERQLILKNIMTAAEWAKIRDKVHYRFEKDHYYSEFKHQETMSQRLDLARNSEEYVGKYYSKEWFRANILRQTAAEVEKQDELIAKEAEEEGGGEEGGEEEY